MKELIERLRTEANLNISNGEGMDEAGHDYRDNNFSGVAISNREALQIADALKQAMHPTAVTAALARLNYTQLDPVFKFAAIDRDSGFYAFDEMPFKNEKFNAWYLLWEREKNPSLRVRVLEPFNFPSFDWEQMLFQRTESGWIWVGKPE